MNNLNDFKLALKADLFRNFGEVRVGIATKLFNGRYKFFFLFRLCQFLYANRQNGIISKLLYRLGLFFYDRVQRRFCVEIEPRTKIGRGLFLPHLNGIVLNPDVIIGDNCTILHQVTIGNNIFKGLNSLAVIGDNVQISAGAKIIGPCKIGSNVVIGANSVVTKNISDNQVVAGVPSMVLSDKVSSIYNEYLVGE